ncbi:N-acetylmuramoyl-L-alanine amidase [Streptococcus pyogenes]|nr:N-acetylmuramoyl-L-alanine amidase [Streptococcus pyogenes]
MTDIVDRFRAYDSWTDSIIDHGKFLNDNPRYKAVVGETDYKKACHAIKDAGYATASGYAELLIQIIKENGLQFWDAEVLKSNKEEKMISSQCRDVIEFFINLANAGMGVDKDSFAGWQCADVPCYAAKHWFDVDLWGNAIDLLDSAAAVDWEVHRMPTNENPRAGAFFVQSVDLHQFGHTGIVIEDSDGYTMRTVEQNIDGNPDALYVGAPARFNTRDFTGVIGWFYPPYQGDTLIGDQTAKLADDLIKEGLDAFVREYVTKYAVAESVQKVEELSLAQKEIEQNAEQAKVTAEAAEKQAKSLELVIAKSQKMANLQAIHLLTSGSKVEPDIYKSMLELIEPAKQGEYQAYDVFTVVDESHEEQAGEGNLVFVHVNESFTYDKQTLKELESEDKVTVIKYADLVKQD